MADMYITRPRRVGVKLDLRPAEIASAVLNEDVLAAFTIEELDKLLTALNIEHQARNEEIK